MKKAMIFVVLVGLLVLCATSVWAATVYFDYMPSGTAEGSSPAGPSSLDCSDYHVGMVVPVKKLQFGLEYSSTDAESSGNSGQITTWKITGGYQCFKTDKFELNTDFSYFFWKVEEGGTSIQYSPFLIGIACKYRMNDKMFISGLVDYATPDFLIIKGSTAYPADYTTAQVKYSYLFTKDFAASLGYKWSKLIEHYVAHDVDIETITKGFTLGASYNF